jgi:diketogulonate reductase-like aldo/keto reductase
VAHRLSSLVDFAQFAESKRLGDRVPANAMTQNATNSLVSLNSGTKIPQLGLGVWQSGGATKKAVAAALAGGYRHIDTAAVYGNEAAVGAAVAESGIARSELFVTTKLWNQNQGYDAALRAFDASLQRLKLEYVDLFLIHWPVPGLRLESWRALEELFANARARAIGVSNFLVPHLQELLAVAKVVPAINQIELTPFLQRRETVALCQSAGICLTSYSPLTRGQRLGHPVVVELAARARRSPAQVLLRWGIQKGFFVLPKSVKPERIEENARLFDFELDDAAISQLDGLEEHLVTGWNPEDAA